MRELTPERRAFIILSHLTEPGDHAVGRLVQDYGPVEAVDMIVSERIAIPSFNHYALVQRTKPRFRTTIVGDVLALCERASIDVVIPSDDDYPSEQLRGLGTGMPFVLYVRGDAGLLAGGLPHSVAIVGARAATSYGEHVTGELVADLVKDHLIVSGAAYGIDGAAHRMALAAGGKTVAFLAGGVDRMYPAGHQEMGERIIANGALASEVPPGSAPTKWRFLLRNRLIAALGEASIVVEAGFRSGSLNEAGHARSLGRPVGAVPGPVTSAASAGCHRLIQEGASLITSAADIRALTTGE
jgi:DNA processing protein